MRDPETIARIVDVFTAGEKEMVRSMLSESLRAVISQTLLKNRSGDGRVAAHEILISTPAVRNLIRENKITQLSTVLQTGQAYGMQTLDQALQGLLRQGLITVIKRLLAILLPLKIPLNIFINLVGALLVKAKSV